MSQSSSPVIHRAARTYGRPRKPANDDTSFDAANTSVDSNEDPDLSTSLSIDHDLPPTSDDADAFNTSPASERARNDDDEPSGFQWGWKAQMKKIDDGEFDDKIATELPHAEADDSETRPPSPLGLAGEATADPFSGSLPYLTSSSQPEHPSPRLPPSRRRRSLPPSPGGSDSDAHSSSPQRSSEHPIGTPRTHSSPTPPTSIEMPPKKGNHKGKARAVPPIQYTSDEGSASGSKLLSRKKAGQDRVKRVKAPTKKDQIAMQKTTARMIANQSAQIQPAQPQAQWSISTLQSRIKLPSITSSKPAPEPAHIPSSDPIQEWSSPRAVPLEDEGQATAPAKTKLRFIPPEDDSSSSDRDLPELSEIMKECQAKDEFKRMQEFKLSLLQQQSAAPADDDDDDLEIVDDPKSVARDEAQIRHGMAVRGQHATVGSAKQLAAAGRSARRHGDIPESTEDSRRILARAAMPTFLAPAGKSSDKAPVLERQGLNKHLLSQARKQAERISREKEEDFQRRGGKLKPQPGVDARPMTIRRELQDVIGQRKADMERKHARFETVQDSDSDEEWVPENNAMDVVPEAGGSDEEPRNDVEEQADDEGDDENPFIDHPKRSKGPSLYRPKKLAIQSDDEDDDAENRAPAQSTRGRVLVRDSSWAQPTATESLGENTLEHQQSLSSLGDHTDGTPTEDGTDKENDVRLSFDRGEDKENTVIAVQSPMASMSSRLGRGGSQLFAAEIQASPAGSVGRSAPDGVRSPLRELAPEDDDDPFAFTPGPLLGLGGPSREGGSLEASPLNLGAGSGLAPAFTLTPKSKGKGRARSTSPSPFGEPLDLGGDLGGGGGGFSQFFTQEGNARGFDQLKAAQDNDDIALTADTGLKPALDISTTFRKKADEIFEKEQEQIALDEVSKMHQDNAPEMFVDANGFLTQTRPSIISPTQHHTPFERTPFHLARAVRFSSPSGSSSFAPSSGVRAPLGILSTQDPDDDDVPVRRRIRKRDGDAPLVPSRSPSPQLRSIFDVLGKTLKTKDKGKSKRIRSEFIEGEAEESDDDIRTGFGFGVTKKGSDDEDDDDEDQDRVVEGLVDDKEMDAKTLAEEAVLEKYREDEEKEDLKLQKIATDAATGALRVNRKKRGVGLDDSDSEDDDGGRAHVRAKRQRTKNDSIAALAKNQETKAFAEEYSVNMIDDDAEFAHLKEDKMELDLEPDQREDSEEELPEITAEEVRKQLRQVSRREEAGFDAYDVSWADADEDEFEEEYRVREVASSRGTAPSARRPNEEDAPQQHANSSSSVIPAAWQQWAKSEKSSRTGGIIGRNTGASAAVTGHSKGKSGSGSFKGARASASSSTATKGTKISKAPSILKSVSDRRAKFGS